MSINTDLEKARNDYYNARDRYDRIKEKEFHKKSLPKMEKLVGKCFRFKNSYSCPQKPEDYWYLYVRVAEIKGKHLVLHTYQKDSYGNIEIKTEEATYGQREWLMQDRITEKQFCAAIKRGIEYLNSYLPQEKG